MQFSGREWPENRAAEPPIATALYPLCSENSCSWFLCFLPAQLLQERDAELSGLENQVASLRADNASQASVRGRPALGGVRGVESSRDAQAHTGSTIVY